MATDVSIIAAQIKPISKHFQIGL